MRRNLQSTIDAKFGSHDAFCQKVGIRTARLALILQGWVPPTFPERESFSKMLGSPSHWLFKLFSLPSGPSPDGIHEFGAPADDEGVGNLEDIEIREDCDLSFAQVLELAIHGLETVPVGTTKTPSAALKRLNQSISMQRADFEVIIGRVGDQTLRTIEAAVAMARAERRLTPSEIINRVFESEFNRLTSVTEGDTN